MDPHLDHQYACSKWSLKSKSVGAENVVDDFIRINTEVSDAVRASVPHRLNISYGNGDRQKYDLYGTDLPANSGIIVFIHGGYWQALTKESSAMVVKPLYEEGLKIIIADYDLAPTVTLECIVEEIKELEHHVLEYAVKIGAKGVWLMGHSAGAHLASVVLMPEFQLTLPLEQKEALKGLILISGVYDLSPLVHTENNSALKLSSSDAAKLSTHTFFKTKTACKLMITLGKHESPEFHRQSFEVYEMSIKCGNTSELLILEDDDHFTIVENLSNAKFQLTQKVISFIEGG